MIAACIALLLSVLFVLPVQAQQTWPNEPSGATALAECTFSSPPAGCGLVDVYNSSRLATDAAAPISPPSVFESRIEQGATRGGSQVEKYFSTTGEIFYGMYLKVNPEFTGFVCCASKMFFLRGSGTNGFFGLNIGSSLNLYFGHNTGGLDNSHTCAADLGLICNPNASGVTFARGQWARIEVYMKSSTTATSRDGIVRWWINGTLAGNYPTLNYPGGFNNWIWTETYGPPLDGGSPSRRSYYIDQLRISAPSGGGGVIIAPPPPPPLAPNKPTNLRVQ